MIEMTDIIERLIDQRTEGVYWDYKEQHHTCKYDLVHDMLCLANAKHQGPRYLIFEVSDSGVVRSIRKDRGRRTQADVADLFRSNASKFADQTLPEFYMASVKVRNRYVDVLVIEDRPHKPYYLIEQYGKIKPHHIYTRVCDTNTPAGESAAPHEIERMYMERAGLGVSLADRIKKYLRDVPNWTTALTDHKDEEVWYYRPFPEITMRSATTSEVAAHNEEWTRGEVRRNNNMARYQEIWCHQTCIARASQTPAMIRPAKKPSTRTTTKRQTVTKATTRLLLANIAIGRATGQATAPHTPKTRQSNPRTCASQPQRTPSRSVTSNQSGPLMSRASPNGTQTSPRATASPVPIDSAFMRTSFESGLSLASIVGLRRVGVFGAARGDLLGQRGVGDHACRGVPCTA